LLVKPTFFFYPFSLTSISSVSFVYRSFILPYFRSVQHILSQLQRVYREKQKALAVLLDPDKLSSPEAQRLVLAKVNESAFQFIFVGGSLVTESNFHSCVEEIAEQTSKPIVLFPGSPEQINEKADALLFLSLISGRNPELLIGQHVIAAPRLMRSKLEVIPTGYMLVESGKLTTALYVSQTLPLPANKPEIAAATAFAGQLLGMQLIYIDAGSGADEPISSAIIKAVRSAVSLPIIVGGGIRSLEQAEVAWQAGADVVVVGTALEQQPDSFATWNAH
jgi:phosphoglycerol geranylgeranyltransferase